MGNYKYKDVNKSYPDDLKNKFISFIKYVVEDGNKNIEGYHLNYVNEFHQWFCIPYIQDGTSGRNCIFKSINNDEDEFILETRFLYETCNIVKSEYNTKTNSQKVSIVPLINKQECSKTYMYELIRNLTVLLIRIFKNPNYSPIKLHKEEELTNTLKNIIKVQSKKTILLNFQKNESIFRLKTHNSYLMESNSHLMERLYYEERKYRCMREENRCMREENNNFRHRNMMLETMYAEKCKPDPDQQILKQLEAQYSHIKTLEDFKLN